LLLLLGGCGTFLTLTRGMIVSAVAVTTVHEQVHQRTSRQQQEGEIAATCAVCSLSRKYAATAAMMRNATP